MVHISEALIGLLVRDGLTTETVGAVHAVGMKGAGVSYGSDDPQVPADREVNGGLVLAWVNPAMRQGAKRRTCAPWLMVVS